MQLRWVSPRTLNRLGVMGINQRNADYVMPYNARHLYPLVDDKLKTKQLAMANGIQVPELYAVFKSESDVRQLNVLLNRYPESVIKPAHGSGGNGILVLDGKMSRYIKKSNGDLISIASVKHHISNILSGMYSLGGACDRAFLEYKVQFDPFFSDMTYQGVPDIRVIVFRGVPVAAMLRLPTRQSAGKANLHQGGVGVGIDLLQGKTTFAVCNNRSCQEHPDTLTPIADMCIPAWHDILVLAMKCADTVSMGYLGVDVVIDRELGPLLLELNARPGLSVQLAMKSGLNHRLDWIKAQQDIPESYELRHDLMEQALTLQ